MLLSSKNIGDFLQAFFGVHVSYCILIIIVGISLLPLLFLKSPQDFWWAVVAAMITTTGALILLVIGAGIDFPLCHPVRGENEKSVPTNYFLGLGTLLFSFGGHAAFPTIVNDMKKPSHFARSSIFAFGAAGCMYIPVSVIAYVVYGNSVRDSVINSIQNTGLQQAVNILITLHCLLALTIIFNPLNQEAEELFNVPHS
ncbi:unnamed protein product [Anisakis simplex]|uniref:Amino acid transporter transmembrane domain-containing protein n=1 Tax=Anisakis simplex TaxID=6269 RepID=A0A3P6NGQ2_ANISI|nr:unnamed protein product [Anisakis simplex]